MSFSLVNQYASLRHEVTRLQAIRIVHFVAHHPISWESSKPCRDKYITDLEIAWRVVERFCILFSTVEKLCLFNPTDLGRWVGGGPFAVPIEAARRSQLVPAAIVLTACGSDDVDAALRDRLSMTTIAKDKGKVEALSWMGFSSGPRSPDAIQKYGDDVLKSPFRRVINDPSGFSEIALLLFQCHDVKQLDDVEYVFGGISDLQVKVNLPYTRTWRPLIVGLLKGNVDAFVILGKRAADDSINNDIADFDELIMHLEAPDLFALRPPRGKKRANDWWSRIRPVALYRGSHPKWFDTNFELLDSLSSTDSAKG